MGDVEEKVDTEEEIEEKEITPDPGQLEGLQKPVKKDPRTEQDKITPDSPRYREIYGKLKDTERKLEQFEGTLKEKDLLVKEMKEWNQKLVEALENNTSTMANVGKEDRTSQEVEKIETQLSSLREEYKKALKNVDYDRATEITEKITDLKLELKDLKTSKKEEKEEKKEKKKEVEREETVSMDPAFADFMDPEKNPWWESRPDMRAYAKSLDKELVGDPKYKTIAERLKEVKKLTEANFKWNKNPNRDHESLESFSEGGKPIKVALTETELRIAQGFGLTPEAYLKQKKFGKKGL